MATHKNTTNNDASRSSGNNKDSTSGAGATAVILGVLAVLVVGAILVFSGGDGAESGANATDPAAVVRQSGTSSTSSMANSEAAATITRGELAERSELVRSQVQNQLDALNSSTSSNPQASAQQEQLNALLENETQLNQTVLTSILDQTLLVLAAEEAGISVSDEEVDTRLNEQIAQIGGEEEFQNRLDQTGQTRELVREDVRDQLYVQQYVDQTTTNSENEINELYNQYRDRLGQLSSSSDALPSLEQLRPQIEAQISRQNRQELLSQARENYMVEVFIEGVTYPPAPAGQPAPAAENNQENSPEAATATPVSN